MQRTVINERYTLIELLGGGGIADVYLAHDEGLDRDVALKILKGQYASDEEFVERFRSKAQSAARLSHPNIVSIYDQGRSEDGAYYVAMEYVPWGTLKDRIRREGALEPGVAAGVTLQISEALSAAHKQGVIHGDVKSQNILVTRRGDIKGTNDVKVTDFGIARAASSSPVAAPFTILDSADYMSPEQAKGESVGRERPLLFGRSSLRDAHRLAALRRRGSGYPDDEHANEPPRSPREANPAVPEALNVITLKLLAKNPEDRYASAAELTDDLERVRPGLPSVGPARAPERRRGGALVPATVASLLFALVMLGGLAWALVPEDMGGANRSSSRAAPAQQEQQPKPENVAFNKLWQELNDELEGKRPVPGVTRQGQKGNNVIKGTDDRDALRGSDGDDELSGYGDDKIGGGGGNDTLYGGLGSDALFGYEGDDTIDDGDDGVEDNIVCGGFDTVTAGAEDTLVGCEDVTTW